MSLEVIAFHGEDEAVDVIIEFCEKHDFDYEILAPRFIDRDEKGGVNTLAVVIEDLVRCNCAGVGFGIDAGIKALENFIPFLEATRGNNMSKHAVSSSNIKSGVFDMSVMPSIFAKIAVAEKAERLICLAKMKETEPEGITSLKELAKLAENTSEITPPLGRQPNRYFRVSVKAGQQPELIVADTLEDAQDQADDIARHEKSSVIQFYEVFPLQFAGSAERLNEYERNL